MKLYESSLSFFVIKANFIFKKFVSTLFLRGMMIFGYKKSARKREQIFIGTPLTMEALSKAYEENDALAVLGEISSVYPNMKSKQMRALIEVSKYLGKNGNATARLELAKVAVDIEKNDHSLRSLYWAAFNAAELKLAWESAKLIGDPPEGEETKTTKAFMKSVRKNVAFQLSLLELVPSEGDPSYVGSFNKICYALHNSLPYSSGGYASRAHGVATGLKKAGFDVVIISRPGFPLDNKPDLQVQDVPVVESIDGVEYRRLLNPRHRGSKAVNYMTEAADAFEDMFRRVQPSVVVAASNYHTGLPALIAARRLGLPFYYEVRGFWEITRISREPDFYGTPAYKIQEIMEAEVSLLANSVFTLTGPMKEELMRRGVPGNRITLLPNSCHPERFVPRPRDTDLAKKLGIEPTVPVIGYIGTFVQYEGLDLLVEACSLLKNRGFEFRLLLVGSENVSDTSKGPIQTEVERIASKNQMEDWVILPGRVPHDEVEAYYSLIDIAPFPRKSQPVTEMVSPMKPLEAYAMEKAVVASNVAALKEMVIHDETGLLFEKDDINSLSEALERLVGDSVLRKRLGENGRKWVIRERNWNATVSSMIKVIEGNKHSICT